MFVSFRIKIKQVIRIRVDAYPDDNFFVEQRLLLCRHNKVVGFIFVVDNVLQVDARSGVEVAEELLIKDESDA